MKSLIIFAVLIAACYADVGEMLKDPQRKEWAEQCAKEAGADLSEMAKGKERLRELMQQKPYRCFMKCFSMKSGLVDEKGDINLDKLDVLKHKIPNADPDKLREAAAKCSDENKQEDLCDKVTATTKCIVIAMKPI